MKYILPEGSEEGGGIDRETLQTWDLVIAVMLGNNITR